MHFLQNAQYYTFFQVHVIVGLFVGFYSFFGSYCVGFDFGRTIDKLFKIRLFRNCPKVSHVYIAVLLVLSVLGFVVGLAVDSTQRGKEIWFSILFAPIGASCRFWLSPLTYEKYKLPTGTLLANTIGAVILAAVYVINVRVAIEACDESFAICWPTIVTFAIGTGFCACLTTVSTMMGEIHRLRVEHPLFSYFYAILTVVICQLLSGIINGVNLSTESKVATTTTTPFSQTTDSN